MDTLTHRFARFVAGCGWDRLRQDTVAYQKILLLDFLGVALFASRGARIKRVARMFENLGGIEESTALVGGRMPAPYAAYVNSMLAHGTDWDDSHLAAVVHPGAVVLPAVLAVGEHVQATGRQIIAAAVAGYEVIIRLGRAIQPQHMLQGFHGTATCGVFGSAAASARLLGLDAPTTASALGLAASSASGLGQFFQSGSSVKSFQVAKSAHDGIMAALLAASGVDAPDDALEGEKGFFRAYAPGTPRADPLHGLGAGDSVLEVMIKRYPIAAHLHGAVDAAMSLAGEAAGELDDIRQIDVLIDPAIAGNNNELRPRDLQAARMSLPFCIACTLWANAARPEAKRWLDPADLERGLLDDGVRSLTQRVRCRSWPGAAVDDVGSSLRSRVIIHADGRSIGREAAPRWGWQGERTAEEAVEKFSRLTAYVLDAGTRAVFLEAVLRFEEAGAASGLLQILRAATAPH
jgi:2-methylcitrate dehydratase PrpD